MSFNLQSQPGKTIIVNAASTAPTEDGTWTTPYKTIQAAINAHSVTPTDVLDAFTIRTYLILPGIYDEDLFLPASGFWTLRALDGAYIGVPGGASRALTWNAVPGGFGQPAVGVLRGLTINGDFTITALPGVSLDLLCEDTGLVGFFDGTGISSALTADIEFRRGVVDGGLDANASVQTDRTNFDSFQAFNSRWLRNMVVNGDLILTDIGSSQQLQASHVIVTGNVVLPALDFIDDMRVSGSFTQAGNNRYMRKLDVTGPAIINLAQDVMDSSFNNGLTVTGGLARFHRTYISGGGLTCPSLEIADQCSVAGNLTVGLGGTARMRATYVGGTTSADTIYATDCRLLGPITVQTNQSLFLISQLGGPFTGPVGSLTLDGPTNWLTGAITLLGGATKVLAHDETV